MELLHKNKTKQKMNKMCMCHLSVFVFLPSVFVCLPAWWLAVSLVSLLLPSPSSSYKVFWSRAVSSCVSSPFQSLQPHSHTQKILNVK